MEKDVREKRTCDRCGGPVEAGFAAVSLDGTATPLFWIAGVLERERLTSGAKIRDKDRFPIRVMRCEQCGRLEWDASADR